MNITIGKGRKQCKKCETVVGARALRCTKCKTVFKQKAAEPNVKPIKRKRRKRRAIEYVSAQWKELRPGDIIKVKQNSGPFYGKGEERQSMGYHGLFRVQSINSEGLCAFPYNNKSASGFCFIYMGPKSKSEETGIYRRSHIIRKIIENKG